MVDPRPASPATVSTQALRYVATGAALALSYAVIYGVLVTRAGSAPLLANTVAFVASTLLGYAIHSTWSFAGHGRRDRFSSLIFAVINLAASGLNSFWTWIIADLWGEPPLLPLIPILLITPWLSFYANRRWAFGRRR